MTTRQVTQFYIYFLNLRSNFVAFNFVLESSQNSFSVHKSYHQLCRKHLICKRWNSGQKLLTIQTAYDNFLESKHPEDTKNQYYVQSYQLELKTLILVCSSWTEGASNFIFYLVSFSFNFLFFMVFSGFSNLCTQLRN